MAVSSPSAIFSPRLSSVADRARTITRSLYSRKFALQFFSASIFVVRICRARVCTNYARATRRYERGCGSLSDNYPRVGVDSGSAPARATRAEPTQAAASHSRAPPATADSARPRRRLPRLHCIGPRRNRRRDGTGGSGCRASPHRCPCAGCHGRPPASCDDNRGHGRVANAGITAVSGRKYRHSHISGG